MSPKVVFVILTIAFSIGNCAKKYNTQTYSINPGSARNVITGQVGKSGYYVFNVGKPTVTVEALYGNAFKWISTIGRCVLKHAQSCRFQFPLAILYGGLKVTNNDARRAFVHAYVWYYGFPEFDESDDSFFKIDTGELLKNVIAFGVSHVPVVGDTLSTLVDFFWPEKEEDVWEQVEKQVTKLVDSKIEDTVKDILKGALKQFKRQFKIVLGEIDNPNITETVSTHFINIAEDLIGFEERFQFEGVNSANANFFLLPLFANTINLKLTFYQYGIKNWQKIGLNKEHINRLTYYIFETIHNSVSGAVVHVHKACDKKLDSEYENAYSENLFDQLANIHAFCALSGLEHLPLWKSIAANPNVTSKPYVPVIVYSTQFGRNTARQSAEMVELSNPALTPALINGKLNIPTKVTVFLTSDNRVGGLTITSADGKVSSVGPTRSGNRKVIVDFEGKRLIKVSVRGLGQIDGISFIFEDGRIFDAGTARGFLRQFTLDNHHIIGFFMTSSMTRISPSVAANIAVSYQLMET